jgi:DNA-binding transcriptional regulator YdaS (Cro superfamily)
MSNALDRAVHHVGNLTRLARRIGKRQSTVWYWKKTGAVPTEFCAAIEAATEGSVTREELRPDVFGPANEQAKR